MDGGAVTMSESEQPHIDSETSDAEAVVQQAAAEVDQLARQAAQAAAPTSPAGAAPVELPDFGDGVEADTPSGINMLGDVDLDVRIELGRTRMLVDDVLRLSPESVVELDKAAGDPVDIYVNGRHVARGEVLVLNENFCVRVSEIIGRMPEAEAG
jgi:flagellar motor switch protein FliN/FliY